MSRWIVASLVAALLSISYLGYRDHEVASHACNATRVVAAIGSDTLNTQIQNSRALLPKISFPGLSHQELVALTTQKERAEKKHLLQLEQLARESCE